MRSYPMSVNDFIQKSNNKVVKAFDNKMSAS